MKRATAIRVTAASGALAVVLGAFGAHGLKALLARNGTAAVWETAVFYHFIHTVMLYVLAQRWPAKAFAWTCFLLGILVFSGSLYLLAITNERWLGIVTPVGGLAFIVGWAGLFVSAGKSDSSKET